MKKTLIKLSMIAGLALSSTAWAIEVKTEPATGEIKAQVQNKERSHEHKKGDKNGMRKAPHDFMFKQTDTDKDGKISKAEWVASSEAHFAKLDADKDGNITKDEMKQAHKKMKEAHKKHRGDKKHDGDKQQKDVVKPVEATK